MIVNPVIFSDGAVTQEDKYSRLKHTSLKSSHRGLLRASNDDIYFTRSFDKQMPVNDLLKSRLDMDDSLKSIFELRSNTKRSKLSFE